MSVFQSFRLALKSILGNRMRSLLTMLGMIIGVASVIVIVGLMNGASGKVANSYSNMGINSISISVSENGNKTVTQQDMYDFYDRNKDLASGISPNISKKYVVKHKLQKMTTDIKGISESYDKIKNLKTEKGRFINYADILYRQNHCVLGAFTANEFFGKGKGIGETIRINGENFKVVGVIGEMEGGKKGSLDDGIYISYSKMMQMNKSKSVEEYEMMARTAESADPLVEKLEAFLMEKLKNRNSFFAFSMSSMIQSMTKSMGTLSLVLSGVAAISLLVAGIGIMNIMLVSVTERTQEIGIRKSLGARRRDILSQFIIEAAAVSGMGGSIGIITGVLLVYIIGMAADMKASPNAVSILLSFGISVATGILFGYMPAKKAAALNPIDALRGE